MKISPFTNGFKAGLALQIGSIGPICLLLFQIASIAPLSAALQGVWGATAADALFMTVSIMGIMRLINKFYHCSGLFKKASGLIIVLIGLSFCLMAMHHHGEIVQDSWNFNNVFLTVFCLNLLNPVAIVCYTGIFTAKAVSASYRHRQLIMFAAGILTATPLFLSFVAILGHYGTSFFPPALIAALNLIVGMALIYWGICYIAPHCKLCKMINAVRIKCSTPAVFKPVKK